MIAVKIQAGLGNQLFQYAFAWALAKRHRTQLLIDANYARYYPTSAEIPAQEYHLNRFGILPSKQFESTILRLSYPWLLKKIVKKIYITHWQQKIKSLRLTTITDDLEKGPSTYLHLPDQCYLDGFFQYPQMFDAYKSDLMQNLRYPKPSLSAEDQRRFEKANNPVAINLRRREYLHPTNLKNQGICHLSYYDEAIHYIKSKITNPTFFLISDDVPESFDFLSPVIKNLIPLNEKEEKDLLSDFYYLQRCHHLVIANSSYSWWATYLNKHQRKIVIAPALWVVNPKWDQYNNTIIPKQWIRL